MVKGETLDPKNDAQNNKQVKKNSATSLLSFSRPGPAKEDQSFLANKSDENSLKKLGLNSQKKARSFSKFRFNSRLSATPNTNRNIVGPKKIQSKNQDRTSSSVEETTNNSSSREGPRRRPASASWSGSRRRRSRMRKGKKIS